MLFPQRPCANLIDFISFNFIITLRSYYYYPHLINGNTKDKRGFPHGLVVKNPPDNAGDTGFTPELGRSLENEMATHSSILAWKIPWKEELGGLQSMGSQRVGHDWATKHTT